MEDFYIAPRERLNLIAWDLDATLSYKRWKPNQKKSVIGPVIPANVELVRLAAGAGYDGFIHTSRHDMELEQVLGWLEKNGLTDYMLQGRAAYLGKPLADYYVDDKALNPLCGECRERFTNDMKRGGISETQIVQSTSF